MALNISSTLTTSIGIEVADSYARITANDGLTGTNIVSQIAIYLDKTQFESGADPLPVIVNGQFMPTGITIDYNREQDGTDILAIAHDAWIAQLSTWGINSSIVLG